MHTQSSVELKGLKITTNIGTYGPNDVVPDAHILDLSLQIDPKLVLIDADGMDRVFDYDPLIAEIDRLARDGHYETQERLMTRIAEACAVHEQIEAVEIALTKAPVLNGTGTLGVRLSVAGQALADLRPA